MKNKRLIFWSTIIVGLVLLMVWYVKKPAESLPQTTPRETDAASPALAGGTSIKPSQPSASSPARSNTLAKSAIGDDQGSKNKGELIKEGLDKLNDVPIVFYGKIEDQFGS